MPFLQTREPFVVILVTPPFLGKLLLIFLYTVIRVPGAAAVFDWLYRVGNLRRSFHASLVCAIHLRSASIHLYAERLNLSWIMTIVAALVSCLSVCHKRNI